MANKRCSDCGKFMKLDDLLFEEDELDEELALLCGYSQEFIDTNSPFDEPLCHFVYVQDYWVCSGCGNTEQHVEGEKYYFNPESGNYDAEAPLTDAQRATLENERQEAAGQLRLGI